jgi:AI-2 transport protein TqsA
VSENPDAAPEWPLPRGLIILLGAGAAVLAVAGLRAGSDFIGPIFLASVLTVAIHPLRGYLERRSWPAWAATLACILVAYLVLIAIVVALLYAVTRFATLLPRYQADLQDLVGDVTGSLSRAGVGQDQIADIGDSFDPSKLVSLVGGLLSGLLGTVSGLFFLFVLLLFLGIDAGQFPAKLTAQRPQRGAVVTALESFAQGTRRYLVVATAFGFVVAVLDTGFLLLTPIPDPLLWGLLAFITNYIPNIGFIIGLVPVAVLGLLEGGIPLMLGVIAVYSLVNIVIQSVIQPKVVGDAVGLSATLSFLSLVFWAWVLGAVGALLAIPLSLLVKALLVDIDPSFRWLNPLIGDTTRTPDPVAEEGKT